MSNSIIYRIGHFIENIYPNPAKDYLKVILKDNSKVKDIFFVDLSGKILQPINVYQLNSRELDVYVSNLDNGIYLLNVNTNKEFNKVKVIIDR